VQTYDNNENTHKRMGVGGVGGMWGRGDTDAHAEVRHMQSGDEGARRV